MLKREAPSPGLLLALVLALVVTGLLVSYSASFWIGRTAYDDPYYFIERQSLYVAVGLVIMVALMALDYRRLRRLSLPLMVVVLAGLAAVLVPGVGVVRNGAARWLALGPVEVQPGEGAKLALVMYMAAWLAGRGEEIRRFSVGLLPFALIVGTVGGLIVAEPDMGTAIIVVAVALAIFFVARAPLLHILAVVLVGAAASYLLILSQDYRMSRIQTFLAPDRDPLGAGYQMTQMLTALGAGGITGLGWGASRHKLGLLPNAHTDGVFVVVGEELGLVGALAILTLLALVLWLGLRVAREAPDRLGQLTAAGVVSWLGIQSLVNLGGVTGIFPLTGVPLPFFSYGGSAMVSTLAGVGLLLSVARRIPFHVRAGEVRRG
jgi:cell division protein FtsW